MTCCNVSCEHHTEPFSVVLACSQFKTGELQLKSNNLSTLAILREFITKEATMQKIRIQLSFKLDPATVAQSINSLWPRMRVQLQQTREDLLLEALKVNLQSYWSALLAKTSDLDSTSLRLAGNHNARR